MKYNDNRSNVRRSHRRPVRKNRSGAMLLTSLMLVCALAIGGLVALNGGSNVLAATAESAMRL